LHGWRARIGLIIPSANFTMEPEFYKMIPEGVTVHTSRMLLTETTSDTLVEMERHGVRAAEELKTAGVDLLIFGCTSGSFLEGVDHDIEIMRKLKDATGIPAITTSTAVLEALRLCQIRRVSVASPYVDEINKKLHVFLEANGFEVIQIKGLGLGERKRIFPISDLPISTIGMQSPYVSYRLVRKIISDDADGYFISCTNFRTIEIIQMLEDDLSKPVITSNQASLAIALKQMGIHNKVRGFGSLFER